STMFPFLDIGHFHACPVGLSMLGCPAPVARDITPLVPSLRKPRFHIHVRTVPHPQARWSFFFSSRRRHTRSKRDWSSDVCSSDLAPSDRRPPRRRTSAQSSEPSGTRGRRRS